MKITLQKDWDNLPSGECQSSPYFSGRERELTILEHILSNKNSGCILLTAPRGTGKTDLVYKAIENTKKNSKGFEAILLNGPQIIGDNKLDLCNIITRIYTVFCDKDLDEDLMLSLTSLYKRSRASDYRELFQQAEQSNKANETLTSEETKKLWHFSFSKRTIEQSFSITTITSALSYLGMYITNNFANYHLNYWIPLAIGIIAGIYRLADFGYSKEESNIEAKKETNLQKSTKQAEILYLIDKSGDNLEYDLRDFLVKLREHFKFAFIIDELDKLPDHVRRELLVNIVQFKSLFNHSDALFLFIGDPELYTIVMGSRVIRDATSTLFNQVIYLDRPSPSEMANYLKLIAKDIDGANWEDFCNYVLFHSEVDFYFLSVIIHDLITRYEDSCPVIEFTLGPNELRDANKQAIMSLLIDKYSYKNLSSIHKNESLVKAVRTTANSDKWISLGNIQTSEEQISSDFMKLANRMGLYDANETITGDTVSYEYIKNNSSGSKLVSLEQRLEYEEKLISETDNYNAYLLRIFNLWFELAGNNKIVDLNEGAINKITEISSLNLTPFNKCISLSNEIKNSPSAHSKSLEEIQNLLKELESTKQSLTNNIHPTLKKIMIDLGYDVFEFNERKELLDNEPNLQAHLIDKTSFIITGENGTKSVFIFNPDESISGPAVKNINIFKEINKSSKLKVIEFYSNNDSVEKISGRYKTLKLKSVDDFQLFPSTFQRFLPDKRLIT